MGQNGLIMEEKNSEIMFYLPKQNSQSKSAIAIAAALEKVTTFSNTIIQGHFVLQFLL